MVNYRCNAACRHCLYACSASRRIGYISKDKIREICHFLVKRQIRSVHIGGGEPFLDFKALLVVIQELAKAKITLDYIETNAFWAHDPECEEYLTILNQEGVNALCISVDPFHAEYVPWEYPLKLAHSCEKLGMGYFLWKQGFLKQLSSLDGNKRHTRKEIERTLSADYIKKTSSAYGIKLGGRAINIEEEYVQRKPIKLLLDDKPCDDLLSTCHFHVDLEGNFIPPGCTGIYLPLKEVLEGIKPGHYPVFESLYTDGITGLYRFALQYGFSEDEEGYPSKCNLCFRVREFLASRGFTELDEDFYRESLKYY